MSLEADVGDSWPRLINEDGEGIASFVFCSEQTGECLNQLLSARCFEGYSWQQLYLHLVLIIIIHSPPGVNMAPRVLYSTQHLSTDEGCVSGFVAHHLINLGRME